MLAHDLVDRPTQDVDLFTPDPSEVMQLADALAVALRGEGAQVNVDRREPGFTRLAVTVSDGRSVVVEVAHDARIREAVQLSFGRVLHPEEVAADKTLALFGRAAARDLVDVAALSERYTLEQLCELAAEKDQVSPAVFSPMRWPPLRLTRTLLLPNSAWSPRLSPLSGPARLGGGPYCLMLRAGPPLTLCGPSAHRDRLDRKRPALPAVRDRLNIIGHHRSTRGETAHHRPFERPELICHQR